LAALKIKDRVCRISLGKESLVRLYVYDSSTKAGVGKKSGRVECGVALLIISMEPPSSLPGSALQTAVGGSKAREELL
jgi:hypothetical protein